jgi:hypothetical protein
MAMLKKSNMKAGGDNENPTSSVNPAVMQQWNGYVDWLESKGMKGSPELDKGDTGLKMMESYKKENPSFKLTKDDVGVIQQKLQEYRDFSLGNIKQNKLKLSYGGREVFYKDLNPQEQKDVDENYMGKIKKTSIDKFPGQFTTSTKFSSEFMSRVNSREVEGRVGFNPMTPTQNAAVATKVAEVQGAASAAKNPRFSLRR